LIRPRHTATAHFLNVLRVLDVPEAFGLLAPRPLTIATSQPRHLIAPNRSTVPAAAISNWSRCHELNEIRSTGEARRGEGFVLATDDFTGSVDCLLRSHGRDILTAA